MGEDVSEGELPGEEHPHIVHRLSYTLRPPQELLINRTTAHYHRQETVESRIIISTFDLACLRGVNFDWAGAGQENTSY